MVNWLRRLLSLRTKVISSTEAGVETGGLEHELLAILQWTTDGIVGIDGRGQVTSLNAKAEGLFGYKLNELRGRGIQTLIPDLYETGRRLHSLRESGEWPIGGGLELLGFRKDGTRFPIDIAIGSFKGSHRQVAVVLIRDITERKRMEEALRASEERYRMIVQCHTDLVYRLKPNGIRTFVSESYARAWGKKPEELLGTNIYDELPLEDQERIRRKISSLTPENPIVTDEHLWHSPLGKDVWEEWTDRAIFDKHGRIVEVQAVGRDITERKRMEEALRASEERYRMIVHCHPDLVYRYKPDGTHTFVSENYARHLCKKPEELLGTNMYDALPPEDQERIRRKISLLTPENPTATDEHLWNSPPRKAVWTEWTDRAIFNEHGRMVEVQAVGRDITERKRMEQALRASEERFRMVVQDQTELIYRWEPDGTRTFVNQSYCRAYGKTPDELVGTNFFPELPLEDQERIRKKISLLTPDNPIVTDEHLWHSPLGKDVWEEWTDRAFFSQDGEIAEVQSVGRDITERKLTEVASQMVSVAANEASTIEEALQVALDRVCAHTGWPVGHVYLPATDTSGELVPTTLWHLDNPERFETFRKVTEATRFAPGVGLPGRVLARGKPAWIVDVTKDPNFPRAKLAQDIGVRAGFAFPVLVGAEVVAVLEFFSREVVEPDESLLEVMAHVGAAQLGRVVERQRAHAALQESAKELYRLFDLSGDLLFIGGFDGSFRRLNPAWEKELGYPIEKLSGRSFMELVHPEDVRTTRRQLRRLVASEKVLRFENRILCKDGSYKWFIWNGVPFVDEGVFYATGRDITERKLAEDLRRRYEFIVNSVTEMMTVINRDYIYEAVNDAWCAAMGKSRQESVGSSVAHVWGRDTFDLVRPHFDRCFAGEVISYEAWLELPRRGKRFCEIAFFPFRQKGDDITHAVAVTRDTTERQQMEAELIDAKQAAEAASRSKSTFLAAMSHEIRTPMNAVVGMIDLLHDTDLSPDQLQMMNTVRDASFGLLNIIDDILDFSKIEAGKLELESIPFCVADVVETVGESLAPNAAKKELQFEMFIDPNIPERVQADPVRLRQILFNLVGNAIKFTGSEDGKQGLVWVRAEWVSPEPEVGPAIRFRVLDNGIGMSKEMQARLFQPFEQAESSMTRRYGGTGLGLSICARETGLMGGKITVESTPGAGSEFVVLLPCLEVKEDPGSAGDFQDLEGLKILVVARSEELQEMLSSYLRHRGAAVEAAESLEEGQKRAAEMVAQISRCFDIVVLSGEWARNEKNQLREWFRAQQFLSEVRFVVLAGRAEGATQLDYPDSVLVMSNPMRRSGFLKGVAFAAGRGSPDIRTEEELPWHLEKGIAGLQQVEAAAEPVLVAEDNPVNQMVILRQLNKLGYVAEVATNGREAIELLRKKHYGLLLTDCHMPEIDGFELTKAIRAAEQGSASRLPIVAITANALKGEADRCLSAGMDDYVAKPVELRQLERIMSKWLPKKTSTPKEASAEAAGGMARFESAPIDRSSLKKLGVESPAEQQEILRLFVDTSPAIMNEIHAGYSRRSASELAMAAHKLKSSAQTIGAIELAELCEGLEKAGMAENWNEIDTLRSQIDGLIPSVERYINQLLSE